MDWIKDRTNDVLGMFRDQPYLSTFATIGGLVVAKMGWCFLKSIWKYVLRPATNLYKTYGSPKAWAIVTGGSSGIGLAYAKQLAKAGFNLLLIARDEDKLKEKRAEIEKESLTIPVEIQTLAFDFAKPYSEPVYAALAEAIQSKEIAILVNNVGIDYACEFFEFTSEALTEMLNVNIYGTTFLTWLVVPKMMARGKHSAIVNISSTFTTTNYVPYFSVYIGTKAYMDALMNCLYYDLKEKNIDILTCLTGEVSTPRNPMKSMWHATPESVAKGQLAAVGKDKMTAGGIRHALYGIYLRSCMSMGFRKWIGNQARAHTVGHIKKPLVSS